MLEILEKYPDFIEEAVTLGNNIKLRGKYSSIFYSGMGGSGMPGDFLKAYVKGIPVTVNKGYNLPAHLDRKALAFVVSYSGNTEETLGIYRKLKKKGIKTVVITSGGKLASARNKVIIPRGMPPRMALPYMFFPILNILRNAGMVKDFSREVKELLKALHRFDHLHIRGLAERLHGKIPLVYSSDRYWAVARRWKILFNENTKVLAFWGSIPELDHNELLGHNKHSPGRFHTIILKDKGEGKRMAKRIELTSHFIRESGEGVTTLNIPKGSLLTKLFTVSHYGEWLSYYLAMEYGVDPAATPVLDRFKKKMGD